eukprot:1161785-Pelagomonas_calceolata.AAC.13
MKLCSSDVGDAGMPADQSDLSNNLCAMSELRAMQAHRSEQAAEVSQVEAEEAEITARNTQLNKHAAGLQNEDCADPAFGFPAERQ